MNYQGWKFVAVKNKDMINAIADAVRSRAQKVASWRKLLATWRIHKPW